MLTPSSNPLVTMIVLCYNQARFVVETLEGVKAQTYKNTELVIIDDCSTDDSVAVIERWLRENQIQCTFIPHQKNLGICKSLNEALAASTGKYISMIAADDIWLPDKIERQVAIMESQPDSVGVLYSDAIRIDEKGRVLPGTYIPTYNPKLREIPPAGVFDALLDHNFVPGMTTLIRRACYDVVGLYDEDMPSEDWDMWLRIVRHHSFAYSPVAEAKYRVHPDSFSRSDPISMIMATIKIFAKQPQLGPLDEKQKSIVDCTLALYCKQLPAAHFDLAIAARRNGSRAGTVKHLIKSVRTGGLRLRGSAAAWTSLLGYGLLGIRRLRWWRGFKAENS